MRKIIVPLLVTAIAGFSIKTAYAADTGAVSATVTVQNVSITVADGAIAYGLLATNTTRNTSSGDLDDTQTVTNNGNTAVDLNIRGADSAAWTLAGTAGADNYVHGFCIASCTVSGNYTALTTNYQALASAIAAAGTQDLDLQLTTPTSTSTFNEQTLGVTVQAVAD